LDVKATYKFDLSTAKALAADAVEYAKFVKKDYCDTHERVINTKLCEYIDAIMVDVLVSYWRDFN
jgi:hypothetical protein